VNNNEIEIAAPVAKVMSLWGLVGFSTLADAAAFATMLAGFLAAFYSLLLVSEWFWKKLWRPLFEHFGWIKPAPRRVLTLEEYLAQEAKQ
jgi:hypothetical protein